MADERKSSSWWQTIPGALTAVAAFIAAVTGLLGGLNQIGMFDRFKHPATPPPATGSVSRADTAAKREAEATRRNAAAPTRRTPAPTTREPARPPAAAESSRARAPAESGATSAAPGAAAVPSGTQLELAAQSRVCSTTNKPGERFAASVVVPVADASGIVVPSGSAAIMEITEERPPAFLGAKADSLVVNGKAHPITASSTGRIQREFVAGPGEHGISAGACIPVGGRIPVTLTAPVPLGP